MEVAISATAEEDYIEQADKKGYQTYNLLEGFHFPGDAFDPSLRRMEFSDVARSVGEHLKKQDIFPAKDKNAADLLIMISWGTTSQDVDWTALQGVTDYGNVEDDSGAPAGAGPPAGAATGSAAAGIDSLGANAAFDGSEFRRNLDLLGYYKGFGDAGYVKREQLEFELEEERYFLVLNAFDFQHLLETKEFKQVWSTRYSTANYGTNFEVALDVLNLAASDLFGQNSDHLLRTRFDPDVSVQIGETEVIETVED